MDPARRKRLLRIAELRRLIAEREKQQGEDQASLFDLIAALEAEVKADLIALNKKRQRLAELKQRLDSDGEPSPRKQLPSGQLSSTAAEKIAERLAMVRQRKQDHLRRKIEQENALREELLQRKAEEAALLEKKGLEAELKKMREQHAEKKRQEQEALRRKEEELQAMIKAEKDRLLAAEVELARLAKQVEEVSPHELEMAGALPEQQFPDADKATFEPCTLRRWSWKNDQWSKERARIAIAPKSFARGAMRQAFRCLVLNSQNKIVRYVCKAAIKENDNSPVRFEWDVKMQNKAAELADAYNKALASKCRSNAKIKKIQMLEALIVEVNGRTLALEEYIEGDFRRYGNNFDFFDFGRNTPNAFSCFSLHYTHGKMVVVDVQGVGDVYTDPQIHCNEGAWGVGNFKEKGIAKFRETHKHNNLCLTLGTCRPHEVQFTGGTKV